MGITNICRSNYQLKISTKLSTKHHIDFADFVEIFIITNKSCDTRMHSYLLLKTLL